MGRTRANIRADDHQCPFERSQSKTNPSGDEALFHCNCCQKDITDVVRIKCHTCPDFDLCVECFSVGAEVWPHKSDHPYKVRKHLSVPIISPDWSAEQEMLLLEGIDMFGPSNWAEVAEHVTTKNEQECAEHYSTYYLSTPNLMPEIKNPDQILTVAKGKDFARTSSTTTSKGSEPSEVKNNVGSRRVKASEKSSKNNFGSSSMNSNDYNPKRHEFDVEYDNDAEKLLVDLEFNENDTEIERELKLRVVRTYNRRLDERQRVKDFVVERGLIHTNPIEKDFTPEEKDLCWKFDPLMRYHSKEEHDELLKNVIEEHRIQTRIRELEEARAAGFRTKAKTNKYIDIKRRVIAEEKARLAKQSESNEHQVGGSSGGSNNDSRMSGLNMPAPPPVPSRPFSVVDLLSKAEKQLCRETGFSAEFYLKMHEIMARLIFKGTITKKLDAHRIFGRVEPSKVDRVYDMLGKKGVAPPPS